MRQKDVWHLKFRNSEVCIWCHVSEFKFQKLDKLKNTKRIRPNITFRPQIVASSIAELVIWAAESAMVQIRWLGVWLLWVLIRIPTAWGVLARICRAWFSNCARIQEFGSRWKWYSTLMRVASSLNFVGSWIFMEAWCVAIGFLESKQMHGIEGNLISLKERSLQGKPIVTKELILWLCDPTPTMLLLLLVGT